MNLKNVETKKEYRIPRDNVAKLLYIPALRESIIYRRSVGYFTSSSFMEIAQGLVYLIKNNGKMELIISPVMSEEDIEAINAGYDKREQLIEKKLIELIKEPIDKLEEEKLNLL